MLERLLTAGDKVEVMRTAGLANSQNDKKVYYSLLVDIDSEDKLTVTLPIEASRVVPLSVGDRYWFVFYTHSGIYQAKGLIVGREKQGNQVLILLDLRSFGRFLNHKLQLQQFHLHQFQLDTSCF